MIDASNVPGSPAINFTNNTVANSISDLCPSNPTANQQFTFPYGFSPLDENSALTESILNQINTDQYSFISYRHANPFFKMLSLLYTNKELCDVTLKVGNRTFRGHRVILASESAYFKAMFLSKCKESKQETIVLQEINEKAFELILEFIYHGKIFITRDNVQVLLMTSCLLQINDLKELCCCFIGTNLDVQNCLGIVNFLDTLGGCEKVLVSGREFLLKNFKVISQSEEFRYLSVKQLMEIISSDDLQVKNEEIVYRALMNWVYHDTLSRKKHLPELLKFIRLPLLSPKFLVKVVSDDDLIKSNKICRNLLDEAKNYHLLPQERDNMHGPRTRPRRFNLDEEVLIVIGGWWNGNALSSVERFTYHNTSHGLQHKTMSLKSFSQFCEENGQSLLRSLTLPSSCDKTDYVISPSEQPNQKQQYNWEMISPMNSSRCGVGAVFYENQLFAIGGHNGQTYLDTFERYEIRTNTWHTNSSRMLTRRASGGVVVHNNKIYAIGGQDGHKCLDIVECYDSHKDVWMKLSSLSSCRLGLGVASLDDGRIFAIGGSDNSLPIVNAEYLDPREGKWHPSKPMLETRKHLGVTSFKNHIYTVGGRSVYAEENLAEVYDPRADNWRKLNPMTTARSGVSLSVYNEKILAIAGYDGKSYLKSYEEYDPELDMWTFKGNINYRRLGCGSVTIKIPFQLINAIGEEDLLDEDAETS